MKNKKTIINLLSCIIVIFFTIVYLTGCSKEEKVKESNFESTIINKVNENNNKETVYTKTMKIDMFVLVLAYKNNIKDINVKGEEVFLVLNSGKEILYDDKKTKTFEEKLNKPDLQDMLEQIYPLNNINELLDKNFDPGRFRSYDLLKEVYGSTEKDVKENLKSLNFGNKKYYFNSNNKALEHLKAITNKLESLGKNTKIRPYIYPLGGTFNYRTISGTKRLSSHAFGTAVDLVSKNDYYWKWSDNKKGETEMKNYPKEIVNIFEENMFIWGGKWNHFDIMHYEYRPEIILKSKHYNKKAIEEEKWYKSIENTQNNQEIIKYIEEKL